MIPSFGEVPEFSDAVTVGEAGNGFTVICLVVDPEHPLVLITLTEYVVVVVGETLIVAVVAPVDHK